MTSQGRHLGAQRPFQETLLGKIGAQRPFQETLLGKTNPPRRRQQIFVIS